MKNFHTPVLLQEAIEALNIVKGRSYIDATIGGGGHTVEILKRGGRVLGIDADQDAIDYVREKFRIHPFDKSSTPRLRLEELRTKFKIGEDLILARGNFREIDKIARLAERTKRLHLNGFDKVFGILFDLGVSSFQLETSEKGFSFQKEAPLDMRMDKDLAVTAKDLVNGLTEGELYELFIKLGEEYRAPAISRYIVRTRRIKPIETTKELAEIVKEVIGREKSKIHPATRVFQALRIAVNDELNVLGEALSKAVNLLENEGVLVVISFHSLEDRIVKNTFLSFEKEGLGKIITKKPITPKSEEIRENIRSRSAKMRIFKRYESV